MYEILSCVTFRKGGKGGKRVSNEISHKPSQKKRGWVRSGKKRNSPDENEMTLAPE